MWIPTLLMEPLRVAVQLTSYECLHSIISVL
jgi:hypothetical protein